MATVSNVTPRAELTATGGQTIFAYTFLVLDEADIKVYQNGTLLTNPTHYSVTGVGNEAGGTIVLVTGATLNDSIVIIRDTEISRTTKYTTGGVYRAATVENEESDQYLIMQELQTELNRSLTLDKSSTVDASTITVPDPVANTILGWNAGATNLENKTLSPLGALSTPGTTVVGNVVQWGDTTGTDFDDNGFDILDEDNMASDSATSLATQQSIKAYADSLVPSTATDSAEGVVELATQAEVDAGTDTAKVVTPATLSSYNGLAGLVFLEAITASSDATIEFNTGIDSTYDMYEIHIFDAVPSVESAPLFQVSTDGGATFKSGASDYEYAGSGVRADTAATIEYASTGATYIPAGFSGSQGGATNEKYCGVIRMFSPSSSTEVTSFDFQGFQHNTAGTMFTFNHCATYIGATTAVNAVQWYYASGNVATGTFILYGVKKS